MPALVLVAAAWVAGLLAAHHWFVPLGIEPLSLVLLSLIPLAAILLWRHDRHVRLAGACVLVFFAAALRYQSDQPNFADPSLLAHYNNRGWVELEGVVDGYPDVRDTWTNLKVEIESIEVEGEQHQVRGTVLIRAPRFPEHSYGDRLRVSGLLETPPEFEDFSYKEYLARKGIYSYVNYPQIVRLESGQGSPFWAALFSIEDLARDALAQLVPDPEASLLQGILLGIRSGIPEDLYEDYNATGTSHIIVISGSNGPANTIITSVAVHAFSAYLEGLFRLGQAKSVP